MYVSQFIEIIKSHVLYIPQGRLSTFCWITFKRNIAKVFFANEIEAELKPSENKAFYHLVEYCQNVNFSGDSFSFTRVQISLTSTWPQKHSLTWATVRTQRQFDHMLELW